MSVLVFAETDNGKLKKSSLEAVSYGKDTAGLFSQKCIAFVAGILSEGESAQLSAAGADAIVHIKAEAYNTFIPEQFAQAMAEVAMANNCDTVVISHTYNGKSLLPRLAVKMEAAAVTGVVSLADASNGFAVKKTCFSNKAFATVNISNPKRVLGIVPNSYAVKELNGAGELTESSTSADGATFSTVVKNISKVSGKIPLTEAEIVVSGGRGLKGPENWGMIEELADLLNAATACSKPVSDMDWRPHSEHVGQTGITIKPNLYIAVGISGAIQHLAGVGSSKVICVVNTDPEAPFFKAADYGIVGDAFDIVPRLLQRAKEVLS